MLNIENTFRQPVCIDCAPAGSFCAWCGKSAIQTLTIRESRGHSESKYFCSSCGKEFIRVVASDLYREVSIEKDTT